MWFITIEIKVNEFKENEVYVFIMNYLKFFLRTSIYELLDKIQIDFTYWYYL